MNSDSPLFFSAEDAQTLGRKPVLEEVDSQTLLNPPKAVQEQFVGGSFEATYIEAAEFLNYVFDRATATGLPTSLQGFRILDFGCGWGRMLRLIRNKPAFGQACLHGCDANVAALDYCRRSLPGVWLEAVDSLPPSLYRSDSFDLIYAYSVFSHLSPLSNLEWGRELARILKPGGRLCLTTQSRHFIEMCRQYREGERPATNKWEQGLAKAFAESDAFAKYDAGDMLFAALTEYYGDAVVPEAFFKKNWEPFGLEIVEWFDNPAAVRWDAQSRLVVRKKTDASVGMR